MKLIKNAGRDRVIDELRHCLEKGSTLDIASPAFSLYAFSELQDMIANLASCRMILPEGALTALSLFGSEADRPYRNRLNSRWLAEKCAEWLEKNVDVRRAPGIVPQSTLIIGNNDKTITRVINGNCSFTTEGLGITPGNQFCLIQSSENTEECEILGSWFSSLWNGLPASEQARADMIQELSALAAHNEPSLIYHLVLYHLFKDLGEDLDEDRIVKSATGIRNTKVWNKLYKFQRDGVIGGINKLERYGGCIIADSVGLGKTFEALAIIKYYELRNDRVLVLCPKRLRDNWTLYKANDRRNILCSDRFNYDVLNHTDLSRDGGMSGDIDLSYVNWGNYDLIVIDESHNFRNKATHKERETRYDKLMNNIIKSGVKTRVLMLSATPVNNRLSDLKNQIAFITEGEDTALTDVGIQSIEATIRQAQIKFNRWLDLDEHERKPALLMEMLGFDYFRLLDILTIARSRKHIVKYYGISETGEFPERLKPVNIKSDVDLKDEFPPISDINNEIRRLNLSAYAPLRYVLPNKQRIYDDKYSTRIRGGQSFFRQADREESLIHLLRVNILKRMESSVHSFALTVERQLRDVDGLISRIDSHSSEVEEISIDDIDVDDPTYETLLIGRKVKVLLQDVDRIRWRQDLEEDRDRLAKLLAAARQITPDRDAKLRDLRNAVAAKCAKPLNPGNKKVLIFTAFAETAEYLYAELAGWAQKQLGVHSAIVTGAGVNKTTLSDLRKDLGSILSSFSPLSKERGEEFAADGELDILIATDCISEGQNLQDCDTLINYDIHWNPVRIIQRFGRIDRIGSPNKCVQLINFWPNIELEEYINLEQRVSGRMVLLDISATGEENIIEHQSGNQMNDLEYRRKQLIKMQETVIDLEDLSSGISIADITMSDFRVDLSGFLKRFPGRLENIPCGAFSVTTTQSAVDDDNGIPPGIIFCLRAESEAAIGSAEPGYPLAPHYLVHAGEDGTVLLPYTQARQALDRIKKLCMGQDVPNAAATARYDKATRRSKDMEAARQLLSKAIASIVKKSEERAVASLFSSGGTHALKGEFQGINDFEVVAFLVALPEEPE